MTQAVGIIDIYWRGRNFNAEKGASFKLPGVKNNPINAGRRTFRSQEWMHGDCKATTVFALGQSASDFSAGDEGELQIVTDIGKTYVSPDAFIVENPQITGGEGGKVTINWNFSSYDEVSTS